jgi:hypothetical protein
MPKMKARPTPTVGTIRRREFKGELYTLEVVEEEGKIKYRVKGVSYASPTAAAKSITRMEVNGWRFWRLDRKS